MVAAIRTTAVDRGRKAQPETEGIETLQLVRGCRAAS